MCLFPIALRIGFNPATYTVTEGTPTVDLVVSVLSGNLARDVDVTLTLQDGTATGKKCIIHLQLIHSSFHNQVWTIVDQVHWFCCSVPVL